MKRIAKGGRELKCEIKVNCQSLHFEITLTYEETPRIIYLNQV